MNVLDRTKRAQIIQMLAEGNSMRATARLAHVSYNTVAKLLVDAGIACLVYHNMNVREVKAKNVECDEIWAFCYTKPRNLAKAKNAPAGAGSVWTWTALDRDSKLIVSWLCSDRDLLAAIEFMEDLKFRLTAESAARVNLSTDGLPAYQTAIQEVFGEDNVNHGQMTKEYAPGLNKLPQFASVKREVMSGDMDPANIGTSFVERQNLTMRMHMRRFTRKTNGHSKKLANHICMLALYFVWYNFCRVHNTLKTSPAVAAGLDTQVRDVGWIIDLI